MGCKHGGYYSNPGLQVRCHPNRGYASLICGWYMATGSGSLALSEADARVVYTIGGGQMEM